MHVTGLFVVFDQLLRSSVIETVCARKWDRPAWNADGGGDSAVGIAYVSESECLECVLLGPSASTSDCNMPSPTKLLGMRAAAVKTFCG